MAKVLTFSRQYPAYHPKKGQPTYFVEKIVQSLHKLGHKPFDVDCEFSEEMYYIAEPKWHTIRKGNRWKVGDKFSPRVWSAKPYCSKQITIAPDIEVKKVWDVVIMNAATWFGVKIKTDEWKEFTDWTLLAKNDGLTAADMIDWFKKENLFRGQIICWNENINY